jgi:hypothetical protein
MFGKTVLATLFALSLAGCQSQQVRRMIDPNDFWGPSTFDSFVADDSDPTTIDAARGAGGERVAGVC